MKVSNDTVKEGEREEDAYALSPRLPIEQVGQTTLVDMAVMMKVLKKRLGM